LGLTVSVTHDPPETAKWDPIARRLFSQISRNWAGEPLTSLAKMLNFIRTTTTEAGLAVNAYLIQGRYDTGVKVSDRQMRQLSLRNHDTLGRWNYTLRPSQNVN